MRRLLAVSAAVAALALAACHGGNEEILGPPTATEIELAQAAAADAEAVASTTLTDAGRWIRRLYERLREADDPEARACLAEAHELRVQARAAYEAGRLELARELAHQSFLKVLCAVVEVFPEAPARTGEAVDQIVLRIEERLGDRDAPRIRRILAHVEELRAQADAALAGRDPVTALDLNLRALHILQRLVDYVYHHRDDQDDSRAMGELSEMPPR